jgi:hypothetical protein
VRSSDPDAGLSRAGKSADNLQMMTPPLDRRKTGLVL